MAKEDKLKALDAALGQIEKQFGKGSVMKLGDSGKNMNVQTVPTGSLSLDIALDWVCSAWTNHRDLRDRNPVVRQP